MINSHVHVQLWPQIEICNLDEITKLLANTSVANISSLVSNELLEFLMGLCIWHSFSESRSSPLTWLLAREWCYSTLSRDTVERGTTACGQLNYDLTIKFVSWNLLMRLFLTHNHLFFIWSNKCLYTSNSFLLFSIKKNLFRLHNDNKMQFWTNLMI